MVVLIKWSSLQTVSLFAGKKFNEIEPLWFSHQNCNAFDKVLIALGGVRKSYGGREPKSCLGQFFNFKLGHSSNCMAYPIMPNPRIENSAQVSSCKLKFVHVLDYLGSVR
jgi:hypothetical protein